jgi:hypothetical protein
MCGIAGFRVETKGVTSKTVFSWWVIILVFGVLAIVISLMVRPYQWNVTAPFHMDVERSMHYDAPQGFVVLDVPGYDGMQYYHIARTIPRLFTSQTRTDFGVENSLAYSYQRFLLPLLAFSASLGSDALLPWSFLLINAASLLGTSAILLQWRRDAWLPALALSLGPSAMVGLHFNLAEPLTLLLITAILVRHLRRKSVDVSTIILVSAAVLTREINVFFAGLLLVHAIFQRKWRDAAWLLIPVAVFVVWHGVIFLLFSEVPFLWSTEKRGLPFVAMFDILMGKKGWNSLTFSSVALMALFFVPAFVMSLRHLRKTATLVTGLRLLVGEEFTIVPEENRVGNFKIPFAQLLTAWQAFIGLFAASSLITTEAWYKHNGYGSLVAPATVSV